MTREFVFLPEFDRQWKNCGLNDDDLKDLEALLCEQPESGDLIKGTGGLRKLRWALPSGGKSGGSRVLYVDFAYFEKIYMLACFAKNVKVSLTKSEKNQVKSQIEDLKKLLRSKKS
jgi:phage-related protein